MLKSLKVENFRSFKSFELTQLGRINLLVGENNSGKTSILEAIQLLQSRANLASVTQTMVERGEVSRTEERSGSRELDIRHLFHGHELVLDQSFTISVMTDGSAEELVAKIEIHEFKQETLLVDLVDEELTRDVELVLTWSFNGDREELKIPLSADGGIRSDYSRRMRIKPIKSSSIKVQFITSSSLLIPQMIELFDQVVLTPEEDNIVQALQTIDPKIERIASLGIDRMVSAKRGGFVIKRRDEQQPLPIGSMGDGIWRMLGLALSVVCTKGGILLVDEIDTGLHFTAMLDMWKMIWKTAQKLNVQVFATTHSRDCWESLAEMAESEMAGENEIMIHRIEKAKSSSVTFDSQQMAIAVEEGIEVR
ncbi:AAA family ATPase [Alkalinema sp. FACHB-956]|nr:AAA family ATPase [Alkalinema sp. FACHB-956]